MLKGSRKMLHWLFQYFSCFCMKHNSFVRDWNSYSKIVVVQSAKENCLCLQQWVVGVQAALGFPCI